MNAQRRSGSHRHGARLATALVAIAIVTGCGSAKRGSPAVDWLDAASASVQRGKLSYDRHCYKCHTEGEGGLGPSLNDKPLPKFLVRAQVRAGLGVMPAFSQQQLSSEELDDLLSYLVALRRSARR